MVYLIAGLVLFFGMHMLPHSAGAHGTLVGRLGEKGYKGVFSLVSLAGVVLIVFGMMRAEFVGIWWPPAWTRHVAYLLMLLAAFSLVSRLMVNNFRRIMPHPMLLAFGVWGLAHLLVNGDLASILLFGAFTVFSFFKIWSLNRRKPQPKPARVGFMRDVISFVLAVLLLGALMAGHPWFAGVALMG